MTTIMQHHAEARIEYEAWDPVTDRRAGQGIGDNGDDLFLARFAVAHLLDVASHLRFFLRDVLGEPFPGFFQQANRAMAIGAGVKRVFFGLIDVFIPDLGPSSTGMPFFASRLLASPALGGGFLVRGLHAGGSGQGARVGDFGGLKILNTVF